MDCLTAIGVKFFTRPGRLALLVLPLIVLQPAIGLSDPSPLTTGDIIKQVQQHYGGRVIAVTPNAPVQHPDSYTVQLLQRNARVIQIQVDSNSGAMSVLSPAGKNR